MPFEPGRSGNPATQFRPGQSGNPGGRPKGQSLTSILRDALARDEINGIPIEGGKTVADLVVEALIGRALEGNLACVKEIIDRIDGKVGYTAEPDGADKSAVHLERFQQALNRVYGD